MWAGRPSPYLGCSKHFFRHSGLRRILSETKVVLAPLQGEDASSRHLSRHGGRIVCHPQICPPPSSCRYNVSTALHNPKEFHFLRARPGRTRRPALSAAVAAHGRFSNDRKRASKEVPNYPEWFRYGRPQLTGTASGSSRSQARLDQRAFSYGRWSTAYGRRPSPTGVRQQRGLTRLTYFLHESLVTRTRLSPGASMGCGLEKEVGTHSDRKSVV
jgi:hypothetical protein